MFAAIAISRTTFISCGAAASSTWLRAADGEDQLVAGEIGADRGEPAEPSASASRRRRRRRVPITAIADGEPQDPEQRHDERRHEERVAPVGGDLVVEGRAGHGASRGRAVSSG